MDKIERFIQSSLLRGTLLMILMKKIIDIAVLKQKRGGKVPQIASVNLSIPN